MVSKNEVNSQEIIDIIRMLERVKGASVALGEAARWSEVAEVRRLLEDGCPPDAPLSQNNVTALMLASSPSVAKLLVKYGADVNAKDKDGCTPLLWFLKLYYSKRVALAYIPTLIELGADIEVASDDGKTAIELAKVKYGIDLKSVLREKISQKPFLDQSREKQ